MKKLVSTIVIMAMALTLVACGSSTAAETTTEAATGEVDIVGPGGQNPWVEYDSLKDVNDKVHGAMVKPDGDDVKDTYFAVMNDGEMGEYRFTMGGMEYTFRFASATTEDISGVWTSEGTVFDHAYPGETEFGKTDTMKLARWLNIDGQYVLMVEDKGQMADDAFAAIVNDVASKTNGSLVNYNGEN